MPIPIEVTTVGVRIRYKLESTPNTRPTANFIDLVGVASAPAFDMTPETIDVSTLKDYYTQYMPGRQDTGGDAQFTLNHSEAAIDAWNTLVTTALQGQLQGKKIWFEYYYPNCNKSYFFSGQPLPLGNGGVEQNSASTIPAHVIPNGIFGWYACSTYVILYCGNDDRIYVGTDGKAYDGNESELYS